MKNGVVELPGLRDKLPPEHGLAGRTPLEIMAACSEKRMAEGFMNRLDKPWDRCTGCVFANYRMSNDCKCRYQKFCVLRQFCEVFLHRSSQHKSPRDPWITEYWIRIFGQTRPNYVQACQLAMSNSSLTCRLSLIGSGTSWHATLLAEYLIEYMARIPVEAHYASEYRYHEPALQSGDVVFIVSMSGETADAVESLRQITKSSLGGKVLKIAVVNSSSSTLARECDLVINVQAGAEVLGLRIFNRSVLNCLLMLCFATGLCVTYWVASCHMSILKGLTPPCQSWALLWGWSCLYKRVFCHWLRLWAVELGIGGRVWYYHRCRTIYICDLELVPTVARPQPNIQVQYMCQKMPEAITHNQRNIADIVRYWILF